MGSPYEPRKNTMKKSILLAVACACLSGRTFAAQETLEKEPKQPVQAEQAQEAVTPLERMSLVPMPDHLKPGKVTSVFPLAGGDALEVKGSWVVLSSEGQGMFQLAPSDDQSGKRARMLVVSSDKMDSDVEFGSRLLKTFRETTCKDKEKLTAESIPEKAVLIQTAQGAAFFSSCSVGDKALLYAIDSIKGSGKMRHGILYGVDEDRPGSPQAATDLSDKAIREYQSMFLKVTADLSKGR